MTQRAWRMLLTGAVTLALGLGTAQSALSAPAETGSAAGAAAKPAFQLPFPCDTTWQLNTWGHNPALDMVVEGNTGSEGERVQPSAAGTVAATYWDNGSGNTVQINHGGGWFTAYYHLKDRHNTYVEKGDKVEASTRIGRIGSSGNTTHAHLHFEQRYKKGADFTDERDRVPAYFDGKKYAGQNAEWKSVTSRNCWPSEV